MPFVLCQLKTLEGLIMNRNLLTTLPMCIEFMTHLTYLDLYDNPIRSFPDSFERMSNLSKVDLSGIRFGPTFQETWRARMPNTNFVFDNACDCME